MARRVKDSSLDTREARLKLKPRGKPYWRLIERKLHLGYRRLEGRSGTWVRRRYDGDQRYTNEWIGVADDYSDADGISILDFWQAQDKARGHVATKSGPLTINDAMESYLEFLDSKRKSVSTARCHYELHIKPALGGIQVAQITADQIRRWHANLAKSPAVARTKEGDKKNHRKPKGDGEDARRRQSSANRVLTTLRAALNKAWRDKPKQVPSNAEWSRVEAFEAVEAARGRYLDIAECKRLLNACDPDFRSLVQAALETGARYGELIRLTVSDFNKDSETIAIRQSKSGKPRHINLTDEGAKFFHQVCVGKSGSAPMFTKASGGAWRKSHQQWRMALACQRAKIEPTGFHTLRHTWASLSVMNSVPLMVVAKNLGHRDTKMIEAHYGHLAPSYIKEAIRKGAPKFGFKPDTKIAEIA